MSLFGLRLCREGLFLCLTITGAVREIFSDACHRHELLAVVGYAWSLFPALLLAWKYIFIQANHLLEGVNLASCCRGPLLLYHVSLGQTLPNRPAMKIDSASGRGPQETQWCG